MALAARDVLLQQQTRRSVAASLVLVPPVQLGELVAGAGERRTAQRRR
jgi:hypothetical protein